MNLHLDASITNLQSHRPTPPPAPHGADMETTPFLPIPPRSRAPTYLGASSLPRAEPRRFPPRPHPALRACLGSERLVRRPPRRRAASPRPPVRWRPRRRLRRVVRHLPDPGATRRLVCLPRPPLVLVRARHGLDAARQSRRLRLLPVPPRIPSWLCLMSRPLPSSAVKCRHPGPGVAHSRYARLRRILL